MSSLLFGCLRRGLRLHGLVVFVPIEVCLDVVIIFHNNLPLLHLRGLRGLRRRRGGCNRRRFLRLGKWVLH